MIDEKKVDTPSAFDTPQEGVAQESTDSTIDEIIFGTPDDRAFGEQVEEKQDETSPFPTIPEIEPVVEKPAVDNPERFQYWQSEADKTKSENLRLQEELNKLSVPNKPEVADTPIDNEEVDEFETFPEPPERPTRPRNFSREEAYTDPSSESAKYLDAREEHTDTMQEYSSLKEQWQDAKAKEQRQNEQQKQAAMAERTRLESATKQQISQVYNEVQKVYGASPEQARDFIESMSDPKSLSMENLWNLYSMQHSAKNTNKQPSPDFSQIKKAQQVPSPMGVMPSADVQANTRSPEDMVMDDMINDFKGHDPFNK